MAQSSIEAYALNTREFRNALSTFATGVAVVTTNHAQKGDVGLTINSFASVSLDPPMILWSISRESASLQCFLQSKCFVVNVLALEQKHLSDRFAKRVENKFADVDFTRGVSGAPVLQNTAAHFQCELRFTIEGGDHLILVGEVIQFHRADKVPLLFHAGEYGVSTRVHREDEQRKLLAAQSKAQWHPEALSYYLSRLSSVPTFFRAERAV